MPKVTMAFLLPEDQEALRDAQEGAAAKAVLRDLHEWLRGKAKHEDQEWAAQAKEKLWELMDDQGIVLDG